MLRHKLIRAETKVLDAKKGLVSATVSSETRDRDGDIIRVAGWDFTNFMKHPVLLADHNYRSIQSQIGEWEKMEVMKGRKTVEGIARYYINEGNDDADWGFKLAEKGMAAYSVGFIPDMEKATPLGESKDMFGPLEFNGQEMLETSHITIPSNPDGLQRMKGFDQHPVIAGILEEMLGEVELDPKALDEERFRELIRDELKPYFLELKGEVWGAFEWLLEVKGLEAPVTKMPPVFDAKAIVAASIKEAIAEVMPNA